MKMTIKIAVRWPLTLNKEDAQTVDVQDRLRAMFKAAGCQGDMRVQGAYSIPGPKLTDMDGIIMAECDVEL